MALAEAVARELSSETFSAGATAMGEKSTLSREAATFACALPAPA